MDIIKHLDSLPIDDALLKVPSDAIEATRCKCYLNLSFNAFNAVGRLKSISSFGQSTLTEVRLSSFSSFESINVLLESYLNLLLSTPTLSNIEKTELTEHYSRRKIAVSNRKILPSDNYAETLTLTGFKTWGMYYGTLGYNLNLAEEFEEYYTPSQLVDKNVRIAVRNLVEQQITKTIYNKNDTTASQYLNLLRNYETALSSEEAEADVAIYELMINIITSIDTVNTAFRELRFYAVWLPSVIIWYLRRYRDTADNEAPPPPLSVSGKRAHGLLCKIAELCLSNGLDESSFGPIDFQLIHQSIPPLFFSLCEELNFLRKSTDYEYDDDTNRTKIYEEGLADVFMTSISLLVPNDIVRRANNFILESIAPPGGYSLLAVTVASSLLNRAYILTHSTRVEEAGRPFGPDTDLERLGRVARLLYLAGACLKKTSLEHLQIIGRNLEFLSNLNISGFRSRDLIDGR